MFDCILPIGQTCNITFLLQNAKIKKQTTLFEWFVSPHLSDITNVLIKIYNNTDDDIITKRGECGVNLGDNNYSGHYNDVDFKPIYQRRRDRLINIIKSCKKILFCRFEANSIVYNKEDIDNFINSVLMINQNLEEIKLFIITPELELEHPFLIKVIYNKHSSDPYCISKEINNLFINTLEKIGYDVKDTFELSFTDVSDL